MLVDLMTKFDHRGRFAIDCSTNFGIRDASIGLGLRNRHARSQ